MQALNPALVMVLIPFNNLVLYPGLRRCGVEPTALRRMTAGIAFSGLAWIVVGFMQVALDAGHPLAITWQVLPYALLTFGEVLVSATGLEFAYSQAPHKMKGMLVSCWSLSVTVGNLVGAPGQRQREEPAGDGRHRRVGLWRHRLPDVLLRRLRPGRGGRQPPPERCTVAPSAVSLTAGRGGG